MNYEESVAYLEQAASFGIKPGLERIEAMLKKLGNPETAYKVIHVTGTNGKERHRRILAQRTEREGGYRNDKEIRYGEWHRKGEGELPPARRHILTTEILG